MDIYIASCTKKGGIFHYKLTDEAFILADVTPMDRPMYMTIDNRKMYIVLRDPFENGESGVLSFDINETGELINPSEITSTKGKVACHLSVHKGNVYCANYISGSIIKMPDDLVTHHGCGPDLDRQSCAHAHFIGPSPDQKYICVADLGVDTIYVYDLNLNLYSKAKVPFGHGVRHLAFSDNGNFLFAVNELASTVSAFSYADGQLRIIDTCSCLPESFLGNSTASAIRVKEDQIYVSNRGHDSISILCFDNMKLRLMETFPSGGQTPRDIAFAGKYLLCTNQDSNHVAVLDSTKTFTLINSLNVDTPICVVCMP